MLDEETAETGKSLVPGNWAELQRRHVESEGPAKRWVAYLRFSDLGQRESSIDRQQEFCESYAKYHGLIALEEGHLFADRGESGAYTEGRLAYALMLEAAQSRKFDKLLVEHLDRLGRDVVEVVTVHRRLKLLGIEIHVAANGAGRVDDVEAVFHGLFSQMARERMMLITGLGRFRAAMEGRHVGVIPYGYRPTGRTGEIEIYEPEAEIVIVIFEWFDAGLGAKQIAFGLNEAMVPSPRGVAWTPQTIIGLASELSGMLRQPLYVGISVFGRFKASTRIIDGRKRRFYESRPQEDWVEVFVPHLGFLDKELWVRVTRRLRAKALVAEARETEPPAERASRYSTLLFHGAYYCECGSRMTASFAGPAHVRRIKCISANDTGLCQQTRTLSTNSVEVEILRAIRDDLLRVEDFELYLEEYVEDARLAEEETQARRAALNAKIAELSELIKGAATSMIRAKVDAGDLAELHDGWSRERDKKRAELAKLPPPMTVPTADPSSIGTLKNQVDELILRMPFHARKQEDHILVAALRRLITKVVVKYAFDEEGYRLEIWTSLAGMFDDPMAALGLGVPNEPQERPCAAPWRGRANALERAKHFRELARTNVYSLSDEDWRTVELVLEGSSPHPERQLVDAALLFLRTDVSWRTLPPPYDARGFSSALRKFVARGHWNSAYEALVQADSPAIAGLDTSRFAQIERQIRGRARARNRNPVD